MLAVRLKRGSDLKTSIERFIIDNKLPSATIISAVGSLQKVTLRMAGAQADRQDIRELKGPFEIVSITGNLGQNRSHIHISVSDKNGDVIGGHLKSPSLIDTTAELVIATESTLIFDTEQDMETGFEELKIDQLGEEQ